MTTVLLLWVFLTREAAIEVPFKLDFRGQWLLWVAPVVAFSTLLLWVSDRYGSKPPSPPPGFPLPK